MPYPNFDLLPGGDTLPDTERSTRELTELARTYLGWLPAVFRESPEHEALMICYAREFERLEDRAELVRRQFFPQSADVLLKTWEAMLGMTVEPVGETVEQRQQAVMARLLLMRSMPEGRQWVQAVTALIGAGWTYAEHDPNDRDSPVANTIKIEVPFPPGSSNYEKLRRLVDEIGPAHIDVVLDFTGGFLLDESQLDQEGLG